MTAYTDQTPLMNNTNLTQKGESSYFVANNTNNNELTQNYPCNPLLLDDPNYNSNNNNNSSNNGLKYSNLNVEEGPSSGIGFIASCKTSLHLKTLALSILIWTLIVLLILDVGGPHTKIFKIAVFFMLMVFYLIECSISSTRKYVSNIRLTGSIYNYLSSLKSNDPTIKWRLECYHYYNDQSRNSNGTTTTHKKKRVTSVKEEIYKYNKCIDATLEIEGLENYRLVKVELSKKLIFGDINSQNDYEIKKSLFQTQNKSDQYQDFKEDIVIDGYQDRVLAEVYPDSVSSFINLTWYWIFSLLTFSFLYRIYLASLCGKCCLTITKQLSI